MYVCEYVYGVCEGTVWEQCYIFCLLVITATIYLLRSRRRLRKSEQGKGLCRGEGGVGGWRVDSEGEKGEANFLTSGHED